MEHEDEWRVEQLIVNDCRRVSFCFKCTVIFEATRPIEVFSHVAEPIAISELEDQRQYIVQLQCSTSDAAQQLALAVKCHGAPQEVKQQQQQE